MSAFGLKINNPLRAAPPKIRLEKAAALKKPEPLPSRERMKAPPILQTPSAKSSSGKAAANPKPKAQPRARETSTPNKLAPPTKRKAERQMTPTQRIYYGNDDSGSEDDEDVGTPASDFSVKRQKPQDVNRKLRSRQAFSDENGGKFDMVHASDLLKESQMNEETVVVEFKYPSASQTERYSLVFGKDQINPAEEIYNVAKIVSNVYLSPAQTKAFEDQDTGVVRKMERAMHLLLKSPRDKVLLAGFKDAAIAYNDALEALIKTDKIAENLDKQHHLSPKMIKCLLRQVYDRIVSPRVDFLRKKTDNKDNTYGELHDVFVSEIIDQTDLKSNQVFVDLGSGVGNVVLQAALETGCESWGCEMMETAGEVAKAQKKEFRARCRLWGVAPGCVHLERGDFRENVNILKAIKRADVILVNNEVFGPDLNESLKLMFLDVKDGCKVVSLKSFRPADNKSRNENDSFNQFQIQKKSYYNDYVSWKGDGGDYFIATKDVGGRRR